MNNQPINTPLLEKQLQRKPVRSNVYSCPKGHCLLSFDMDDGVTPMMMRCHCGEFAHSHYYNNADPVKKEAYREAQVHQEFNSLDNPMPHIIWYASTCDQDIKDSVQRDMETYPGLENKKTALLHGIREHVAQGGLLHLYTPRYTQAASDSK